MRLRPKISPPLKRKRIMLFFHFLFQVSYHFTMAASQKHHYKNNPTTQNTFIIEYVAILMAREGSLA